MVNGGQSYPWGSCMLLSPFVGPNFSRDSAVVPAPPKYRERRLLVTNHKPGVSIMKGVTGVLWPSMAYPYSNIFFMGPPSPNCLRT